VRIERVAQPVAEQVERHHQTEDRQPRPNRHPGRVREEVLRRVEHATPARQTDNAIEFDLVLVSISGEALDDDAVFGEALDEFEGAGANRV